jgi:hypothetical protein
VRGPTWPIVTGAHCWFCLHGNIVMYQQMLPDLASMSWIWEVCTSMPSVPEKDPFLCQWLHRGASIEDEPGCCRRLRIMMKMHGLGDGAYFAVSSMCMCPCSVEGSCHLQRDLGPLPCTALRRPCVQGSRAQVLRRFTYCTVCCDLSGAVRVVHAAVLRVHGRAAGHRLRGQHRLLPQELLRPADRELLCSWFCRHGPALDAEALPRRHTPSCASSGCVFRMQGKAGNSSMFDASRPATHCRYFTSSGATASSPSGSSSPRFSGSSKMLWSSVTSTPSVQVCHTVCTAATAV